MIAAVLALLASVAWGSSDFTGGLQTRTAPMPVVLVISQAAGFILLSCVLAVSGPTPVSLHRLAPAALAGLAGSAELGLLYLAISRGPVIVVAPVAAAGAVLPVIAGAAAGNNLGVIAVTGITLALAGAVAAAWEPGHRSASRPAGRPRHIGSGAVLALAAAVLIGILFILFSRAAAASPTWAAAAVRAAGLGSSALLLLASPARRQILAPRPARVLAIMAAVGVLDACGDLSFAFASARGQLAIVAVLASLYPVVTVLLAAGVLRERVRPLQAIGAGIALAGVTLLGAAG